MERFEAVASGWTLGQRSITPFPARPTGNWTVARLDHRSVGVESPSALDLKRRLRSGRPIRWRLDDHTGTIAQPRKSSRRFDLVNGERRWTCDPRFSGGVSLTRVGDDHPVATIAVRWAGIDRNADEFDVAAALCLLGINAHVAAGGVIGLLLDQIGHVNPVRTHRSSAG